MARSSASHQRPSHPAPNVRDDRETPLMWARDVADSAGDLGVRSTAAHWHDGQITCQALAARQGNAVISGARCFATELLNATKFRRRGKKRRSAANLPEGCRLAGRF